MNRLFRSANRCFSTSIKQRIQQERLSRLNKGGDSLPLNSSQKLSQYRNIATIAHIDAGKTTMTERMLYMCGAIPWLGEVHHGTALMDFMEEERKRGITINSACITFSWKDTHINLIDTPGHADFNFEVERSLKVLDGALIIIDGVKGVEAQTETVWRQADAYNLSKLLIINKMDRAGAEYDKSIQSVEQIIGAKVMPAFFPLLKNDNFEGIVDIFGGKVYHWKIKNGSTGSLVDVQGSNQQNPLDFNPLTPASALDTYEHYEEELKLANLAENNRKMYTNCLERIVELTSEQHEGLAEEYLNAIQSDGVSVSRAFLQNLKAKCKSTSLQCPQKQRSPVRSRFRY